VGASGELRILGGLGAATGTLVPGSSAMSVPLFGGVLLVTPEILVPIELGGTPGGTGKGSLTIPWVMPPSLGGAVIFHQVGLVDPGAPFGIAASNGLRIEVGP
jgi:hypothetical protein